MTIQELEQVEDRARRGLPIDPEVILTLTAYLRDVLQAKINAEAVASEAFRKAGHRSGLYSTVNRRKIEDDEKKMLKRQ
jgi:hypothetical protein